MIKQTNKRVTVLDLGTNTFHLLIADVQDKAVKIIVRQEKPVKLGEGGITKGLIIPAAFDRGLNALKEFSAIIKEYQPQKTRAVATAAIRQASNGTKFIQKVKEETGIEIERIDGNREADLIYRGVQHAVALTKPALIMDIGGGSVEFILCDKDQIAWKKSYPIGAARLMALFHHTEPISIAEIEAIHQYLSKELADLRAVCHQLKPETLIGSAGAFETFATLTVPEYATTLNQTAFTFDLAQFGSIALQIIQSTHQERAANSNILPVRVDMIVVAAILVRYILKELQIDKMTLSTYALKEGLLFETADAML